MKKNKTVENKDNVKGFLIKIENKKKREDSILLLEMMQKITEKEPKMWGTSIIGFGSYHYKYERGREGDLFLTGFFPESLYFNWV